MKQLRLLPIREESRGMINYLCLLLLLALIVSVTGAVTTKTLNTHVINEPTLNNGKTKDCQVAVSDDLVGFFCPSNKYLFYHKKTDFLAGDLTNIKVKDVGGYISAKNHRGSGGLIVTGALGLYSHFSVGSLSGSDISTVNYYIRNYVPYNFAFGTRIFVDVVSHVLYTSSKYWFVGILNDSTYMSVKSIARGPPSGIFVRDLVYNRTAALYYTTYDSSQSGYTLTKEEINLDFDILNKKITSIGANCGSIMNVNSNLILVSCPSTTSSTGGVITIYKESDLTFIRSITSSTGLEYMGTQVELLSSTYYHQILFNSKKSNGEGQLSMFEIFVNRRDSSDYKFSTTTSLVSDDSFDYFGKYFAVDVEGGQVKVYISSNQKDSQPDVHPINTMRFCTHNQVYSASGDSCSSAGANSLTTYIQDTSSTICLSNTDNVVYDRMIGESVCDYSCANKQFGKNCESCSTYMSRVGETAASGYNWYNDSAYTCYQVNSVTNYPQCDKISTCSKCLYSGSCEYSSSGCNTGSYIISAAPDTVYQSCRDSGVTDHDYSICGPSKIDLASNTMTYTPKPSGVVTPKDTLCKYDVTYSQKFTDTLSLSIDANIELIIKQTSNGVTTTLTASRRNLEEISDGRRHLSSSSYSVTNADSVSIFYVARSDMASTTFVMSTTKNYYSPTSSPSDSEVTETLSSDSKSSSILGFFLVFGIIGLALVGVLISVIICYKVAKRNKRRARAENHVRHVDPSQRIEVMPRLVVDKLNTCREFEYTKGCDEFNTSNCVVCLDDFEHGVKVRLLPFCHHIFHSKCIEEVLKVSHRHNAYRCPLCNTNI